MNTPMPDPECPVRCACLMMQKDEATLLLPWVLYHGHLFGFENLFVFDNGSTEAAVLAALDAAAGLGVVVDRSHDQKRDFARKGLVLGERMRMMRDQGGWDVLIPLDCDEFLALRDGDGVSFDRAAILAGLAQVRDDDRVPHVVTAYMNVLGTVDRFSPESCLKTFVQARGFVDLDHGFHQVQSSLSETPVDSGFVHIHCHAKPFERVVRDAREKLAFWCDVDSPAAADALEARTGPGWHLVKYLRMTEREYLATFGAAETVALPGFAARLTAVGAETSFLLGAPTRPEADRPVPPGAGWTVHDGATARRPGRGVMVFGRQGPALDQVMRALQAAGLDVNDAAALFINPHWIAAFAAGEAERIRRELLVLGAQPQAWASWFPQVGLLTAEMAEAMRWPRAIQLLMPDEAGAPDCAALRGLDMAVLQVRWDEAAADPALLATAMLAFLGMDAAGERAAAVAGPLAGAVPEGCIDGFTENEVSGWCWVQGSAARQTVALFVDGVERARAVADGFRSDLVSAGIGDGRHGFRFLVDAGLVGAVDVRVVGCGVRIAGGGVRVVGGG